MQTGQFDLKPSPFVRFIKTRISLEIFKTSDLTTDNYHVQSCDLIINCVGIDNNGCQKNENDCINANSLFPEYLASVLSKTPDNNPWVIQLSSTAVYGDQGKVWVDEQSPLLGGSIYAKSKIKGEISPINEQKLEISTLYCVYQIRLETMKHPTRMLAFSFNEFCRMVFKKGNIEIFGEPEKQIDLTNE